jgi:hypothetical protein
MGDLDAEELAQLGLKQIEDAIVALLTRHQDGLTAGTISAKLGLGESLEGDERAMIANAVVGLLLKAGRIRWDGNRRVYVDNPDQI